MSACPSVFPSFASTLFSVSSTISLDFDDTLSLSFYSSRNVATSYHPIINLLNNLNFLPRKGLLNKYANIFLVSQCLTLISPCFALSSTQNNPIPMFIDLLEHDIFLLLAIFSAASLSYHKKNISLVIHLLPGSTHTKCCTEDTHCYPSPPILLNFFNFFSVYSK